MSDRRRRRMHGAAAALLMLAGCRAPEISTADTARMAGEWHGAALLAGQQASACDSITMGAPTAICGTLPAWTPERLSAYTAASVAAAVPAPDQRTANDLLVMALVDAASAPRDVRTLTRASERLRDAAALPDASADVLIDRSAIALQRYAVTNEVGDIIDAIEAASQALDREPSRREALFNRALALTWAGMRNTARREWARHDSLTRKKGYTHLVIVDAVATVPDGAQLLSGRWAEATRERAWTDALPRYARALLSGQGDSVRLAAAYVDTLAALAARQGVDGDVAELRDALRSAAARDTARVRLVLHGIERFNWARSSAGRQVVTAAMRAIDSLLVRRDLPPALVRWLRMEHANQLLIRGRTDEAIRQFTALEAEAPATTRLYALRARSGGAMTLASLGRTAESVARLREVETACLRDHLEDCTLGMAAMGATYSEVLGDVQGTEAAASRVIRALADAPLSQWYWTSAFVLRQVAELHEAPRAVDLFDQEAIAVATQLGRADLATAVALERTEGTLDREDWDAGARLVQELRTRWIPTQSREDQEWSRVNLLHYDAELARRTNPSASVAMLDSAMALVATDVNEVRRTPLRQARAFAQLAAGDTTAALAEMNALMRQLRDRGRGRVAVFDAAREARVMQTLAVRSAAVLRARGDAVGALRALSGQPFQDRAVPPCCAVSTMVSLGVRIVGDSAWLWTPSPSGLTLRVIPLAESMVRAAAELDTAALAEVYDQVIAPSALLRGARTLCLDVRGVAAQVPWNATRDRANQRYLIETTQVVRVDDAALGCAVNAKRSADVTRVAVVSAAQADGSRALPASKREAASLQQLWGTAARVRDASEGSVATMRAMSVADIVHFAGHAIINRRQPDRSYLWLSSGADSMITGATIAASHLTRAPLVILSACDAGSGSDGTFGGFDSLAGAFLGAGASSVIGAAWPVDDAPTGAFMLTLHEGLRSGVSPAESLRRAQMAALRSPDAALRSPRVWAAFRLVTRR